MRKLSVITLFALLLVGTGCQSDDSAQKNGDEEATAEQASEKEEMDKDKEDDKKKEEDDMEKEGEEHPGEEHPGDEHPGEDAEGDEHPGDKAKKDVTAKDIKMAMKSHIDSETDDSGVFTIQDEKAGEKLKLKFVKIHDPVRKMEGKGYFACTNFHVKGSKDKLYDLDFWLNSKDGELTVNKTKIHKHPVKKDGEWMKKARYTFKNDKVVELN
jgi:hypothetical protein